MTLDADAVLAECIGNPDDDAPRLVWADHVGGERGELVVVQCDLARGGLSLAESRLRRARERELLERNAVAWAGGLAEIATEWSFRRGFIESASIDLVDLDASRLQDAPLLSAVLARTNVARDDYAERIAQLSHLRGFGFVELQPDELYAPLASFRNLRALAVAGDRIEHVVLPIIENNPITQLWLRGELYQRETKQLLDAAQLDALALADCNSIEDVVDRPLRALRLGTATFRALAQLQRGTIAATLEHFGFELDGGAPRLADNLAPFERIRTLEIGGRNADNAIRAICKLPLPALRVLRIAGDIGGDLVKLVEDCFGDRLEALALNERPELLHPTAMFELGRPYSEISKRACLDSSDGMTTYPLPPRPAPERVLIGRSLEATVRLPSSMVARHHAALHWRGGRHWIEDLGSTNGVSIGGKRVQRAALADGDEITLGDVVVRYRIVHSVGGT